MKWLAWLGLLLATASWALPAHADLGADVAALSTARAAYGQLRRLKPRLLERGDRLPLAIPAELLSPTDPSCVSVAILGVVEAHFVLRFSSLDPSAPSTAFPEASAAGAMDVTRCGSDKPFLAGALVEMRSPRGVLETLISVSPAGVPRLFESLPARDPGVELALGDPGGRPAVPPLSQRMQRLALRARAESAQSFEHEAWQAGTDGTGSHPLALSAGCHELTLLSETASPDLDPPVDLDLELVDAESGARLAVDRGDDADGSLSWCTGEVIALELRFVGAAPSAALTLTHARWDLPAGIPKGLAPEARAALARVARASHVSLPSAPLYESLGVQGSSALPLEVEPDACYTALLVPIRGEAHGLSLAARVHFPGEVPRAASDTDGASVAFCAHGATHATLEIDSEGSNLSWLLAVWETGRFVLGAEAP
jgi:hypothetical protein